MNYEPNTKDWKPGDLVIHDMDAKEEYMLMRVVKVQKNGLVVTMYEHPEDIYPPAKFPAALVKKFARKTWKNDKKYLHDPARFGIIIREDNRDSFDVLLYSPEMQMGPEEALDKVLEEIKKVDDGKRGEGANKQ